MTNSPRWVRALGEDPRPWLLEESNPAVRAAALTRLMGEAADSPCVVEARRRAMESEPIRGILAAQDPAGWWVRPGPGYGPKYTGTIWNVVFLEQLGADPADERVQAGARYVLDRTTTSSGGFGYGYKPEEANPPPSAVIHCLSGNLLRAVIAFGHYDDDRVRAAVAWTAGAIVGEGIDQWYRSGTSGPLFECAANDRRPCAWGAIKALRGLAAIPPRRRTALVRRAIDAGVEFLLSRDPVVADYPMPIGNSAPSSSWFKLGFPSGYVADVLQNLEVLTELGEARDPRLEPAVEWLLGQQMAPGRWANRYHYRGKTTVDLETETRPSKWVTLRACTVLAAAL
jgi:hypothetical protein